MNNNQFSVILKKFLLNKFLDLIPFNLTKSQIKVLDEIKQDLSGSAPMSRLLQGDVGSGKTIIAISSLLIIIEKELFRSYDTN